VTEKPGNVGPHSMDKSQEGPDIYDSTKASKAAKIWAFLNSNFGLFVCSSMVLASLSYGYHQSVKYQDDQLKIEQLDMEIALRLQDVLALSELPDKNRYNNIENIQRVDEGRVQGLKEGQLVDLFWIRRPNFPEYKEDKNTMSLMWQLYFLAPASDRPEIRRAIQQSIQIDRLIPQVRLKAASDPNSQNNLERDFGQNELFSLVPRLAKFPRWKNLLSEMAK
jgi:hypothetical protein